MELRGMGKAWGLWECGNKLKTYFSEVRFLPHIQSKLAWVLALHGTLSTFRRDSWVQNQEYCWMGSKTSYPLPQIRYSRWQILNCKSFLICSFLGPQILPETIRINTKGHQMVSREIWALQPPHKNKTMTWHMTGIFCPYFSQDTFKYQPAWLKPKPYF